MATRDAPWFRGPLVGWALLAALPCPAPAADAGDEFFERKVRPLLVERCAKCHVGTKVRGKLRLDSRAALLKGGETGPAVVPGDPDKSLLIRAVRYEGELKMPPRTKLTDAEIADLVAWVKSGAPWPGGGEAKPAAGAEAFDFEKRRKHWSFQSVARAAPPAVKRIAWPRSPLDAFVLARLEAKGLAPAPEADRRTLLRRVTFDLTGLPPTPGEIAAFLADKRPDAYERVVDRFLASPAYGERWGRHWLDLMRFAETSGHEFDGDIPEAWRYRDYVIRALNEDVPYDRFVTEHVAGDLVPDPRRHPADRTDESILGTGSWFLGESKHAPVDLRGDGADRRDNQVDVFAKAFLGLTVSCARCHDHKFDPIYTKDYYSLVSYLQSSRMQRAFLDHPDTFAAPVKETQSLRAQAEALAVARTAKALEEALRDLPALAKHAPPDQPDHPLHAWRVLTNPGVRTPAQFAAGRRALVERRKARAAEASKRPTSFADFRSGYSGWFVTGHAFGAGPSRAEAVLDPSAGVPVQRLQRPGVAHSGLASGKLQGALRSRTFTIENKYILYRASGKGARVNLIIDGFQQIRAPIYGGLTFTVDAAAPRWYVQDVSMWVGLKAYVEVLDDGDGHVALERVLFSDDRAPPPEAPNALLTALLDDAALTGPEALAKKYEALFKELLADWRGGKLAGRGDGAERVELLNGLLAAAAKAAPAAAGDAKLAELLKEVAKAEAALPAPRRGLAMADGTGVDERVHIRGSPKSLGPEAPRRLPVVLAGEEQPAPPSGSGRLALARRLTDPSNPLLARVMVNRLWQHHFGRGIVGSPDDFGFQGERPTHPELLDWLATELVRQKWSLKSLHRQMVLSSTYRQSSRAGEEVGRADPRNELLHRMPIRRLEAELVRDAMLAASGRLDRTMYGPGPRPHLTEFMAGRGRPATSGPLDGDGRRSVYLNVRRNFLNPMFLAFDYPVPFTTIGRRSVSNVPAQALTLLNNPFVIQQARLWSARAEPGLTARQRVGRLYETAFGRPPTAAEAAEALAFLEEQGKEYGRAGDARAWADLCHVLFNVKEFIFVN